MELLADLVIDWANSIISLDIVLFFSHLGNFFKIVIGIYLFKLSLYMNVALVSEQM